MWVFQGPENLWSGLNDFEKLTIMDSPGLLLTNDNNGSPDIVNINGHTKKVTQLCSALSLSYFGPLHQKKLVFTFQNGGHHEKWQKKHVQHFQISEGPGSVQLRHWRSEILKTRTELWGRMWVWRVILQKNKKWKIQSQNTNKSVIKMPRYVNLTFFRPIGADWGQH